MLASVILSSLMMLAQADVGTLPLPDYDVERLCLAGHRSMTDPTVVGCVNAEQSAYDVLKRDWPTLSDSDRRWAIERAGRYDYPFKYKMLNDQVSILVARREFQHPKAAPSFRR